MNTAVPIPALNERSRVQSLFEAYLRDRSLAGDKSRRTWLNRFESYCAERDLQLDTLTRQHLEQYWQHLLWSPGGHGKLRSPMTVGHTLFYIRQFLRWCVAQGVLEVDPTSGFQVGKHSARERKYLSRKELEAIFRSPSEDPIGLRDRAILAVFAELALYSRKCRELNLNDLRWEDCRLSYCRLGSELVELLRCYVQHGRPALLTNPDESALFLSKLGGRMEVVTFDKMLLRHTNGQRVSPRLLHLSWQAQRQAFHSSRLPDN